MPQPLSSKESSLFRQVIRHYDSKQYKKGLKMADQILRKNPNHGDTLAMKALIINSQGKTEEAFVLAKLALRNDMKSHVCWHVYGLLYRAEHNYEEAAKAYKFALKLEPESHQIQRDLAFLQVQMRDYQGYSATRLVLLQARPGLRQNWTALAIAHHLAGDLASAENVLTTYENTLKQPPAKVDVEHSEALLYKNSIIAGRGEIERALEHLEAVSKSILDRSSFMEMRADYLLKLGRYEQAEKTYRVLVARNPENRAYYKGLEQSLKGDESDRAKIFNVYKEYAEKDPRSDAPFRIPLDYLQDTEFREAADRYLRRMLAKGVPSTFHNLKGLYRDASKKETIQVLVEGYASDMVSAQPNGSAEDQPSKDLPKLQTSALFFLAQHYDYYLSRDLQKAMRYIDKALEISPESVDYHMIKARIWKHCGNSKAASEVMEHARSLDERDRYINSKAAKYQLRDNDNDAALKTMSKFTRNETAGGPLGDLHDMQCMWYLTEDGESRLRQGNLALALKRFHAIYDLFDVWHEDQFDFHGFSLRKGQVRSYIEMLRWEDRLRTHPFYSRAAIRAVQIYVLLHDQPQLSHGFLPNGIGGAEDLSSEERKKALKKAKREQQKQQKLEAAKHQDSTAASGGAKKADTDPLGTKLIETTDPLRDAMKFLQPLLDSNPNLIDGQTVGFEVFLRRKKYLLALKCLLSAWRIDPKHPTVHQQVVRFQQHLDSVRSSLPENVRSVITSTFDIIPESTPLKAYNDSFLSRNSDSIPCTHAALRVRNFLAPESQSQNEQDLLQTLEAEDVTIEDAKEGLDILRAWKTKKGGDGTESIMQEYKRKAQERWPKATIFDKETPWDRLKMTVNGGLS